MKVKKVDGGSEDFIGEKIVVSCVKAGASVSTAREVAKSIENSAGDEISTKEIKNKVLSMLKEKNQDWETNWLLYDRAVKKR